MARTWLQKRRRALSLFISTNDLLIGAAYLRKLQVSHGLLIDDASPFEHHQPVCLLESKFGPVGSQDQGPTLSDMLGQQRSQESGTCLIQSGFGLIEQQQAWLMQQ